MLKSALRYAAAGFPVFPLAGGCKVPHKGTHGQLDATTNVAMIRRWWARWPNSNVACLTGKQANLFVLDVDVQYGGENALQELEATHGALPSTPTVRTPSGGRHFWFCWPDTDTDIRNSTSRIGPGLDMKANLGSIIAPPSVIIDRDEDRKKRMRRYSWVKDGPKMLAAPPEWLVRLAMPPERHAVGSVDAGAVRNISAYASKVMQEELAVLSGAVTGTRNNALNRCAWRIGMLVKSGAVAEPDAMSVLMNASLEIGLSEREAMLTIRSAFSKATARI